MTGTPIADKTEAGNGVRAEWNPSPGYDQLAAENASLRRQLDAAAAAMLPGMRSEINKLQDKNEQLRAALREIRERCDQVTLTYEERVRFIREDAEYTLEGSQP